MLLVLRLSGSTVLLSYQLLVSCPQAAQFDPENML